MNTKDHIPQELANRGFELGRPTLVCRWRLANRQLPLENRHLRALLARTVDGRPVTTELAAWAKQHLEWNLAQGAAEHPDGVLMLVVDERGQAALSVGPYEPLADTTVAALAARAAAARREAASTGVAPETLWVASEGALFWDVAGAAASGTASLVAQLAQTLRLQVSERPGLCDELSVDALACGDPASGALAYGDPASGAQPHGQPASSTLTCNGATCGTLTFEEVFLVSDEHGVVVASDAVGPLGERLAAGYQRLLA